MRKFAALKLVAVLTSLVFIPAVAHAQRPPTGVVRGVVFDSLLGEPLRNARVMVQGTSLGATTDGRGRFQLDSVPAGRRTLFVEHPAMDSIGLSNLAIAVQVVAGRPHIVDLALPSLWTMRRAACPDFRVRPLSRDTGLVYGALTDAATGARLAGASVSVSWLVARRSTSGVEVERPSVAARTDSVGNFYACGVPTDMVLTVQAATGTHATGLTERLLGERGVARHDLLISRAGTVTLDSATGLKRGRATLAGLIRQTSGDPRPSARVLVDDVFGEVYTNQDGRFVLPNLPAGSQMAMARMIGFGSARAQVDLRDDDTTWLELTLRELNVMDTIRVNASPWAAGRLDEIEARARAGHGHRLDEEQIRDKATLRSAFQVLPNMTVEGRSAYEYTLLGRVASGYCPINVYIDGRKGTVQELTAYRPDHLITIEFFPRASQVPAQYAEPGSSCGAVLVWTRFIR